MSTPTPQARRKAMALKVAKQLERTADLLHEYNLVRRECDDDPRAHQINDGLHRLAIECRELSAWLEAAAPNWASS